MESNRKKGERKGKTSSSIQAKINTYIIDIKSKFHRNNKLSIK